MFYDPFGDLSVLVDISWVDDEARCGGNHDMASLTTAKIAPG